MITATSPRVYVFIVSYNSSETLPRCFGRLAAQIYKDFRVILIDNASQKKPGDLLSRLPVPTTYLEMAKTWGLRKR